MEASEHTETAVKNIYEKTIVRGKETNYFENGVAKKKKEAFIYTHMNT